jgi:peptidoglycan hydrolase-like amidase
VCAVGDSATWTLRLTTDEFRRVLNSTPLTRVGSRLNGLDVLQADAGGRVIVLVVEGEFSPVVRGEELRGVLTAALGARTLRSLRFNLRREGRDFVFAGRGFGHGAGLCQHGAVARLRNGTTLEDVMRYYYPGAVIDGPASWSSRIPEVHPGDEIGEPTSAFLLRSPLLWSTVATRLLRWAPEGAWAGDDWFAVAAR